MSYREYAPHPALAPYVKCFWTLERDLRGLENGFDILPDSFIEVLFNSTDVYQRENGAELVRLPPCYWVGLQDKPFRLHARGRLMTVGIRFYAWGFHPLLGSSPMDMPNQINPLDASWEPVCEQVFAAVRSAPHEQAVGILQNHLLTYTDQMTISDAARVLSEHPTFETVEELARRCFLSRRQLERQFLKLAGTSPKAVARRRRFEQARDMLCNEPSANLSALASTCGYADQAHLCREFRVFSNRTPGQFAASLRGVQRSMRYGVARVEK